MELSLDTASELASVAISREGQLLAEITWRCRRNQTVELLPTIGKLLAQVAAAKQDLTAVFVCTGPGLYTGLRVGLSTAKGLAYALTLPMVGVGRLELDAWPHVAFPGPIIAVHNAGRGELAWAAYMREPWRETAPPRLSRLEEIMAWVRRHTPSLRSGQAPSTGSGQALFCGEIDEEMATRLKEALGGKALLAPEPAQGRAASLAVLGYRRLAAGAAMAPAALKAIYLRQAAPELPRPNPPPKT